MATETTGALAYRDGIAWLVLDDPAKKVNTLSTRLSEWFEEQVSKLERERPDALALGPRQIRDQACRRDREESHRLHRPHAADRPHRLRQGALRGDGEDRRHYPAPLVAVEVVREGIKLPLVRALDVEAGAFSQLVTSKTAKALMSIFFRKNEVEARAARIAKKARPVGKVGVLGAGFMGAGIAQVLAEKGTPVVMKDRDLAALGRGVAFSSERFRDRVKRRRMSEAESKTALGRIQPTVDYAPFRRVDLVVEAVFEDLEVKRAVIRETEAAAPEGIIFASNTSAIPIARLAEASRRPENVVGMHFFSPVHKMPLLEVIRHPGTSEEALATVVTRPPAAWKRGSSRTRPTWTSE